MTTQQPQLILDFGAFARPLVKQLREQGYRFKSAEAARFRQRDWDAVVRLRMRGLIPSDVVCRLIENQITRDVAERVVPIRRREGRA